MLEKIDKHILITAIFLFIAILIFAFSNLDLTIQDHLYRAQTNQWFWDRNNVHLKFIFYKGAKELLILSLILVFLNLIIFRHKKFIKTYKKGLIIVLLSGILIPATVGSLKFITNTPCPRNLTHYKGNYPDVRIFDSYPANFKQEKRIRCWPAGHASGGFALLSLFFLFKSTRNKIIALTFALTMGWTMGGYKMLIGDHFFSHTFITMILSWLMSLIIAKFVHKSRWKYFRS